MKNPVVLTKSNEKQITVDWQREIPSLGIYAPRHLLRRVGPLLVGVSLDRDSGGEIYKPVFHVHCLGKEFPCVSLTLCTQLRSERSGGPDFVEVRWHEQKYKEAATRMVRQSLLPLEGDLTIGQVIDSYGRHMATPMGKRQLALLYRDMIILLAWGGDTAGSASLLAECLQLDDAAGFQHVGGRAAFEAGCQRLIAQPTAIEDTIAAQITSLGVGGLPVSQLLR
jgi:hypothetical protein